MPAVSALFRDMTSIRREHPEWVLNNCTACGNRYVACPDTAIPGLVSELSGVLDTVVTRMKKSRRGKTPPRAVRQMKGKIRQPFNESRNGAIVNGLINEVVDEILREDKSDASLRQELDWFQG